jgi:hypothetical protein
MAATSTVKAEMPSKKYSFSQVTLMESFQGEETQENPARRASIRVVSQRCFCGAGS